MTGYLGLLDGEDRQALLACGRVRRFAKGASLFHARQLADDVMVLLEGRVKLVTHTPEGREVLLGIRSDGDIVGEMAVIAGEPRSASATALEPVQALTVSAPAFGRFLEERPRAGLAVVRVLAERLRDADRRRAEFVAADSVGRLAARLLELGDAYGVPDGDALLVELPISQEELAGWIGVSREAVAKAFATLRGSGWIETGRRSVRILDPEALERRSA